MAGQDITREQLAQLLNEDLSREYQAIIAYVASRSLASISPPWSHAAVWREPCAQRACPFRLGSGRVRRGPRSRLCQYRGGAKH